MAVVKFIVILAAITLTHACLQSGVQECTSLLMTNMAKLYTVRDRCCALFNHEDCLRRKSRSCPEFKDKDIDLAMKQHSTLHSQCGDYKPLSNACGLTTGAIAGLLAGVVVAIAVVTGIMLYMVKRRTQHVV